MNKFLISLSVLAVLAASHTASPAAPVTYALSPDGNAVVRLTSVTPISSASFDSTLVTSAYPGWSVTKTGAVAGSSISTTSFDAAWASATVGGANFTAAYSQPIAVPAGNSLDWVQVVQTNVPLPGRGPIALDPSPSHGDPLYRPDELLPPAQASTPKTVNFIDGPTRSSSSLTSLPSVEWKADLYQAEYDGAKKITVRDGVSWGWNMKPATVGNATGTFLNPSPTCPPATCSGIGGNTITWGIGEAGSLSFTGAAFAPKVGDSFKLGTLTYHNGATVVGSPIDGIDFDIAMSFLNISEDNFTHHSRLSINNTPNTDDPIASADYVAFVLGGFSNTFNVFESDTASVDLMAALTPTFGLTPASVLNDDRSSLFDPVASPSGFTLTLVGFANPTPGGFIGSVPEPSTNILVVTSGLLAISMTRRRRAQVSSGT